MKTKTSFLFHWLTHIICQGLFVYWITNNALSLVQTIVLKQEPVRKYFKIPLPPKPEDTPVLRINNPIKALSEVSLTDE